MQLYIVRLKGQQEDSCEERKLFQRDMARMVPRVQFAVGRAEGRYWLHHDFPSFGVFIGNDEGNIIHSRQIFPPLVAAGFYDQPHLRVE